LDPVVHSNIPNFPAYQFCISTVVHSIKELDVNSSRSSRSSNNIMKFSSIALMSALMVANPAAYAWVAHPPLTTSFSSSRPSFPSRFRTPGRTTATPSSSSSLSSSLGEESAAAVDTRQMYLDWCNYHGKIPSEDRYPIFAQNFMTQWRYDQSTTNVANTSYTSVNEFADWTVEEFQQRLDQIEARIKQIYQEWCQTYGKTQQAENQQKYQTFKDNFLQNMKHYEQTGDFYQLNQFADLTLEEYQAAATTGDQDVRPRHPHRRFQVPVIILTFLPALSRERVYLRICKEWFNRQQRQRRNLLLPLLRVPPR
jgi:Cathepsin propeptide inhibitor domain (I29)